MPLPAQAGDGYADARTAATDAGPAGPAAAQEMAGSLEAGLQALARGLAGAAGGQRPPVLSVMPFPGADQACPVLSVFVVDELTTALINGVQPRPRVVERLQLETVVAQYRLDDFLTDPEQRRRLGGLTGIDALVVGSFVVIGDRLRINARMVGIGSGELIAAQAVSVPRTGELAEMLRQSSGRGRNCVSSSPAADAGARTAAAAAPPASAGTSAAPAAAGCKEQLGLLFCVTGFRQSGREARLDLTVEHRGSAPVGVMLVGPRPRLTDLEGRAMTATTVDGLPMCGGSMQNNFMEATDTSWCLRPSREFHPINVSSEDQYRQIAPASRTPVSLHFRSGEDAPLRFPVEASLQIGVLPQAPRVAGPPARSRQADALLLTMDLREPDASPAR
jgi:TolB-like protein